MGSLKLFHSAALIAFFFIATESQATEPRSSSWSREALRLTGESDAVHNRALTRIRRIPRIQEILRKELIGPQKALALDVISALPMRSLLPDLLELAKKDESGFFYLAANNLIAAKDR